MLAGQNIVLNSAQSVSQKMGRGMKRASNFSHYVIIRAHHTHNVYSGRYTNKQYTRSNVKAFFKKNKLY